MTRTARNFFAVPSYRNACIALAAAMASASSFAADDMSTAAVSAISDAQSQGTTVGNAVVGVVAALCVVGVIIALVRKV